MVRAKRPRPVVLCIVHGFGNRAEREDNAIVQASTPRLDELTRAYPRTCLHASGAAVGLPAGHASHGHVALRTLGAGRAVPTDRARIDEAIAEGALGRLPMVAQTIRIAADRQSRLHLLGLVSPRDVHACMAHLHALIELADFHEVPVVVHAILDGRDAPPRGAMPLLHRLEDFLAHRGAIGTVSGRLYSVDAGDDWDRLALLFHAMVRDRVLGPTAPHADTVLDAVSMAYAAGLDDATVVPTRIGDYSGIRGEFLCDFAAEHPVWEWTGEEVGVAFNHRPDGLRAIAALLTRRALPAGVADDLLMDRDKPVLAFDEHCFASLTEYDPALRLPVAFEPRALGSTCGAFVSQAGLRQLRIGEGLKQAHLTSFFDGGRSEAWPGEERRFIPSAPLLDLACPQPRPRTQAVARAAVDAIAGGRHEFILLSFAGPDLVARTGDLEATVREVEVLDRHLGEVIDAVRGAGGVLLLAGDYGRCERVGSVASGGTPEGEEMVPLWYVADGAADARLAAGGQLSDVAPTVLELLGIEPPNEMTGRSLLRESPGGRKP